MKKLSLLKLVAAFIFLMPLASYSTTSCSSSSIGLNCSPDYPDGTVLYGQDFGYDFGSCQCP